MKFDTVVLADTASTAALSCLSRLVADREAGRRTLIAALVDTRGKDAIEGRRLAEVLKFADVEARLSLDSTRPWTERSIVLVRKVGAKHVLAPLGLMGAASSIDYFDVLRDAFSIDKGRDLMFFEELPECLVPEAVPLRLASIGARLPPASVLKASRDYIPFAARLITGISIPPIFGGIRERWGLSRSMRDSFKDVREWDPFKALGPRVQPVSDPRPEGDVSEMLTLAAELGDEARLGSPKALRRRLTSHAVSAGRRTPIERYWLSLPESEESVAAAEAY